MESAFYKKLSGGTAVCELCPHHCRIPPSGTGWCRTRKNDHGELKTITYGLVASVALDPIEKKPLAYFHPGSMILSLGSAGCNFCCSFCQNWELSQSDPDMRPFTPRQIVRLARSLYAEGNIGVAWTYNEPTLSYEFIRDTAPLIQEAGMVNVMVTNGYINPKPLEALLPYISAWNIDLKAWEPAFYSALCGGQRDAVLSTIKTCAKVSHVELTSLVIPGENDNLGQFEEMCKWIADINPEIPLHITRFFPHYKMTDREATYISTLVSFGVTAKKYLSHVQIGNVSGGELLMHGWKNES